MPKLPPAIPEALIAFLKHHNLLDAANAVLVQDAPTDVLIEHWLRERGLPGSVKLDKLAHCYVAQIEGTKMRIGGDLLPIFGRGETTSAAMAALGDRVRGRVLVRVGLGFRRVYHVPVDLRTAGPNGAGEDSTIPDARNTDDAGSTR